MLTRKTRRMLCVLPIILIVSLIIIVALIYLYTDMFKSNQTLFAKYIGQNIDNVDEIYNKIGKNEYNELLKQNKYTIFSQIEANYIENIGTTSEKRDNSINKLKLVINGQIDDVNKYNYQDIKLIENEEEIAEIEYSHKENTYGIRFSDLFNQYVLINNENLKELFSKMGYTEEELIDIPDKIEINNEFKNIIQFSEEEKENIKTKYLSIINSNVSKENISKQTNQIIEINGQSISTNAYVLALTKEKLNEIYIKLLEEIKRDDIILTKLDKIQEEINKFKIDEEIKLREQFIEKVENTIIKITKNNIGQEEVKIIVYENNQNTLRTLIQNPDNEIIIDILSVIEGDYLQINYKNDAEIEKIITFKKENNQSTTIFYEKENDEISKYSIIVNNNIDGNNCDRNTKIKYEDNSNSLEIDIEKKINIVNSFENELIFDDKNSINLSLLKEEHLNIILDTVALGVSKKINNIKTNIIKEEEIWKILNSIGIIGEEQFLKEIGITEVERTRFNSKFEILQGENLDSEAILRVIEVIRPNLLNMNVVSNEELNIEIDKTNNNEELVTALSTFIENNKNNKYNLKVEYDENTQLVNNIILTIVER